MAKLKLQDLIIILNRDVVKCNSCIEMKFCIDDDMEYKDCWLGKMADKKNMGKKIYWYGLVSDGSQAYEYNKLENILNAKVFHGKSLYDVIEKITWFSLDGSNIEEMLPYYIDDYSEILRSSED